MRHELLVDLPDVGPTELRALRKAAGLNQAQSANLVGLGDVMRWSNMETGKTEIPKDRLALFLLAIDKHPRFRIAVRRQGVALVKPVEPG